MVMMKLAGCLLMVWTEATLALLTTPFVPPVPLCRRAEE